MLDKEVREKFKIFQESEAGKKYHDLDIDDVRFEKISLANDKYFKFKKGKNHYIKKYNLANKGKYPLATGSVKNESIAYHVKQINDSDVTTEKCISFNKDGDSQVFYRDYDFLMDRHHIAIVPTDDILAKYLYFSIIPYFRKMKFGWGENVADVPTVSKHSVPIPQDLDKTYTSFKIQEAIVAFLEFWKDGYTDVFRERVSKKKPIYQAIKKIIVQNTFKNDKFLVEKFNQFSKDKGYNLKFSDIKFISVDIFNDEENIELIGSKKIGSHNELERINDKDGIPVYDASANILTYVEKEKYLNEVFTVENNDNPDISFASEGNSSAGTNFIIHQDSYFSNNHRTVIKFSDKYYSKYIYYNIYKMKEKYGFKRGYIPSQKELRRLKIMISIPNTLSSEYNAFAIQNIFVEFWEMIIGQIDEKLAIYHRMLELTEIIDRAFLYRTFSKIDWSKE